MASVPRHPGCISTRTYYPCGERNAHPPGMLTTMLEETEKDQKPATGRAGAEREGLPGEHVDA